VQLYVLDTPINTTNGDFSGKRVYVYNASDSLCTSGSPGHAPIGGGNQAYGSYDSNHGGKVASIILGNVHGVLNYMQSLTSVVVFNSSGCADDTAFNNAANYVVHSQQQLQGMGMPGVANLSFGTPGVIDQVLNNGVTQMIGVGTFVSAAAGNDSQPASYGSPSDLAPYPGMLSVGATNIYGAQSSYSNYGSGVDIWAPGGENPATGGTGVMTCDGYDAGTSYAAPAVAAAAILYLSKYPYWSPASVGQQIKYDGQTRYGLLQLHIPDGCTYTCTDFNVCIPNFSE